MDSKLLLRNEMEEMWISHFSQENELLGGAEEFKKKVNAIAKKYDIDAVGLFKATRVVKRNVVTYIKKRYDIWYRRNLYTLFQLGGIIEEFAFYDDVRDELLNHVLRMQREEEAGQRKKNKGPNGLRQLVQDKQNVHTTFVVNQTNTMMESVLRIQVDKQKTLNEIECAWIEGAYIDYPNLDLVIADMRKWGNVESVCEEKDWAYRKALRGLWAKIKTNPELIKRLWEECLESVGLCAQGHLSRLANVLVGFEENTMSPVSNKELFQNEFSVLANKELAYEEKQNEAKKLLEKYGITESEWQAWLDAL